MILEISAHARKVQDGRDAERFEIGMWTNARQQEQTRCVDRAGAQNHLRARINGAQLAIEQEIEADAAGPGERQPGGLIPQDLLASMNAAATGWRFLARSTWIGPPDPRKSFAPSSQSSAFLNRDNTESKAHPGLPAAAQPS